MAQIIQFVGPAGCDSVDLFSTETGSKTTLIASAALQPAEISGTYYQPAGWVVGVDPVTIPWDPAKRYRLVLKAGSVEALTDFVTVDAADGVFESEGIAEVPPVDSSAIAAAVAGVLATAHGAGSWETGVAADNTEVLERIERQTSRIVAGVAQYQSPIDAAGTITIVRGSDYLAAKGNAIPRSVDDPGGVKFDRLSGLALRFGAGRNCGADEIVGVVSVDYANDLLTYSIDITGNDSAGATPAVDYKWHIKAVDENEVGAVEEGGYLVLETQRVN